MRAEGAGGMGMGPRRRLSGAASNVSAYNIHSRGENFT